MKVRVHDWLKKRRPRRTQRWLAHELGISPAFLSQIINGQRMPSLPLALRLEEMTGIPARDFAELQELSA